MFKLLTIAPLGVLLLVLSACTPADVTQPRPNGNGGPPTQTGVTIDMEADDFYFDPDEIEVESGQTLTINFPEVNGTHTFTLDEFDVNERLTGTGETVSFTPNKAGTYTYYCAIPGHRERGMTGTLVVTD